MREQLEMEAKERAAARHRAARHRHVVEERRSWRVDEWRVEAVESGGCGQWRSWRVVGAESEEALGFSLWRHSLQARRLAVLLAPAQQRGPKAVDGCQTRVGEGRAPTPVATI